MSNDTPKGRLKTEMITLKARIHTDIESLGEIADALNEYVNLSDLGIDAYPATRYEPKTIPYTKEHALAIIETSGDELSDLERLKLERAILEDNQPNENGEWGESGWDGEIYEGWQNSGNSC